MSFCVLKVQKATFFLIWNFWRYLFKNRLKIFTRPYYNKRTLQYMHKEEQSLKIISLPDYKEQSTNNFNRFEIIDAFWLKFFKCLSFIFAGFSWANMSQCTAKLSATSTLVKCLFKTADSTNAQPLTGPETPHIQPDWIFTVKTFCCPIRAQHRGTPQLAPPLNAINEYFTPICYKG